MEKYKFILAGIVGSKSYGLDTEKSDTDLRGVFVLPTEKILGLGGFQETFCLHEPDITAHEVGKFLRLTLACNPGIIELLWTDSLIGATEEGKMLLDNRSNFVSNRIRKTFAGYALGQAKKLASGENNHQSRRYAKHARMMILLLDFGEELLSTGNMTIRVSPERREELLSLGDMSPEQFFGLFEKRLAKFDNAKSVLSDEPNFELANSVLLEIRKMNY